MAEYSEFVTKLAANINHSLDLPGLSEEQESAWILWLLAKLEPLIPEGLKSYILDASDGISDEEADRWEDSLTAALNEKIDVPWVPELVEGQVIRPIVRTVIQFAKSGFSAA